MPLVAVAPETALPFIAEITDLFNEMDRRYDQAAEHYGFTCRGCADNCCQTRFFHHTALEYTFLHWGWRTLAPADQAEIMNRAEVVCRKTDDLTASGEKIRLMCPLNHEERCQLYAQRPMICRLFGIPHELAKPGLTAEVSPGCAEFDRFAVGKPYYRFDRTSFYYQMAGIEKAFRRSAGVEGRLKLTVAQMLLSFPRATEPTSGF